MILLSLFLSHRVYFAGTCTFMYEIDFHELLFYEPHAVGSLVKKKFRSSTFEFIQTMAVVFEISVKHFFLRRSEKKSFILQFCKADFTTQRLVLSHHTLMTFTQFVTINTINNYQSDHAVSLSTSVIYHRGFFSC